MGGDLADVRLWAGELDVLHERFVHRFNREEPRQSALAYMRGLGAPLERKNGWTLAEEAGHTGPDRIHRLLNRIEWDADEVLDDVRDYVVEHLGDRDAVLIVERRGSVRPGCKGSAPALRAAPRNCQIGVFLACATSRGRTLIDRRLYLPTPWTGRARRAKWPWRGRWRGPWRGVAGPGSEKSNRHAPTPSSSRTASAGSPAVGSRWRSAARSARSVRDVDPPVSCCCSARAFDIGLLTAGLHPLAGVVVTVRAAHHRLVRVGVPAIGPGA
ncbi:transposase [Streptomyces sp. NPDC088254]|uniref:transposase n=1 Tax=Streptomyces sp. NPDC088254 TaxID=3365847 RepID=UPI0038271C4F